MDIAIGRSELGTIGVFCQSFFFDVVCHFPQCQFSQRVVIRK
jgi:hypothetical protein